MDSIQRKEIENIYGKISPFEFKNKLISLAEGQDKKSARTLLDAGRGNPNWTAVKPREAFFLFGQFAAEETRRVLNIGALAGMPEKRGIYNRFNDFINKHVDSPGSSLLKDIIGYGINLGFDPDAYVYELADGIIGDNYPIPDRMLLHVEKIVHNFLMQEMCYNKPPAGKFKIFAVEGATAAMCYIFDTLIANELLSRGDHIALMTPIFTPYLEIPLLPRYNFNVTEIKASAVGEDGVHTWQYPESEIKKLCNKNIKALFVVNPSNPPSVEMNDECRNNVVNTIREYNSDIMVITDDVYGTFAENYRSLAADLPYNSIGVYSFSKYFGVTGWRLGTIAIHEDNVYDKLLKSQPDEIKSELVKRYEAISENPGELPFIDRIVADSRQVALNHTAGLSTPQQVQMAFFAAFALLDKENTYKNLTKNICRKRKKLLFDSLGIKFEPDPYSTSYYTQFDLLEWANLYYGKDFAEYLEKNYKPFDILYRLAEESSIVLLSGGGFHGPDWSIRISLANLNDEAYSEIGNYLHKILSDYVSLWEKTKVLY